MKKISNQTKILLVVFVIALVVRVIFIFSSPVRMWDETVYGSMGYDLSNNPFDYSVKNGWSDYIPSGDDPNYRWPKMGFRPPLLPYILSLFYFVGLDSLVVFLIPVIGALSIVFLYLLGRDLFNEKVGLYSSLFFCFVPLHVVYSSKILNGVLSTFFIILTLFSFWRGYELGIKKYKMLFGLFFALALLSRYTTLWIGPVFLIYFLIRDRSFKFLKDRYLWYSILIFFAVLIPWFIYGQLMYQNIFGAFIHGAKSAMYWGGNQSWSFFFEYSWRMFSILYIVFLVSSIYITYKKHFVKKEIYLLLLWFVLFLGIAIIMPHKELRFILQIVPVVCLLCGYGISKLKRFNLGLTITIICIMIFTLNRVFVEDYNNSYNANSLCLLEIKDYLNSVDGDVLIVNDLSPVYYYYTHKPTRFYPQFDAVTLERLESSVGDVKVYYVISREFFDDDRLSYLRDLLSQSHELRYECSLDPEHHFVYSS